MRRLCSALLLFTTACGGGLERVSFVTDRLDYGSESRVMLSLTNVGGTAVETRLCEATLEAEATPGVLLEAAPGCPEGPAALAPGARLLERRVVRPFVSSGAPLRLRFRTAIVLPSGEQEDVLTPVFTVGGN